MKASFFKISFITFLLSCLYFSGITQTVGLPFIKSFPKESYGHGTQNWEILQLNNGSIAFANNEGLLVFDGFSWKLFPLPNKTILRSLAQKGDTLFVGAQNEFGFFLPSMEKQLIFHGLKEKLSEDSQDFEDVWDIINFSNDIYFRAGQQLYIYQKDTILSLNSPDVHFLGIANQKLYTQDTKGQLYEIRGKELELVPNLENLVGTEITAMVQFEGRFLLATRKAGLFILDGGQLSPWPSESNNYNQLLISALLPLENGELAVGTSTAGLIVLGKKGQTLFQVRIGDGLSSNSVISAYTDHNQNLWLGLENGIAHIETNSPFRQLDLVANAKGIGYDIEINGDQIYFGTNTGLYQSAWSEALNITSDQLSLVPKTSGQVWGLDLIDQALLMSNNDGIFLVNNLEVNPIFEQEGAWLVKKYQKDSNILIGGAYKGIYFIEKEDLSLLDKIETFKESSRFIEEDDQGNLWIAHPYRGIFQLKKKEDNFEMKRFGPDQGLPSYLHNHLFKINNALIVCAEQGLFTYNVQKDEFVPYTTLEEYFPEREKVRRLIEAPYKDIWFITEKEIGYFKVIEKGLERTIEKRSFPHLKKLMNGGFEKIHPIDPNNVFISSIRGFLHYDESRYKKQANTFPVFISEVIINTDSIIYPHNGTSLSLPYRKNSLHFRIGAIDQISSQELKFQFLLEGFDEDWTTASTTPFKEYTKLPYGKYKFQIKATKEDGTSALSKKMDIKIQKPWYYSNLARFFYILIALFLLISITRRLFNQFRALENKMIISEKQSKATIERLETEKIQVQLDHKKRELLSSTIHLSKKNETLQKISEQLQALKGQLESRDHKKQLQKLIQYIRQEENMDGGWDQLMLHFNQIHPDFFSRLKKQFPSLTPKDLKICAYLKMNLSTKEIANLMNISVRGIEASRYRLRKRLDLDSDTNLNDFFMNY